MRIALYSAVARAPLESARALIVERGYKPTADHIRAWRRELIERGDVIVPSTDFYSTSSCRDLCFNVMEHRFTPPRIARFLDENRLTMLGMETSAATQQLFVQEYSAPGAATDLKCWDAFEQAHPRTFRGMYYLWLRGAPAT